MTTVENPIESPTEWPTLERHDLIRAITAPIREGRVIGSAIVGEIGAGKTTTVVAAARELNGGTDGFVRLRGSVLGSSIPYGVLFGLLKNSETDAFANSAAFHSALSEAISAQTAAAEAGTTPAVPSIVVDNAHLCDELSAHALSHLASTRSIRLLLAAPDLDELPEAFLDLWRDGLLSMQVVPPLDADEVSGILTSYLHAPVVAAAARYLTERSGGNPLFLNYLVIEQLEAGLLVRREGLWMLSGRASITSERLIGMLKTRIDQWTPEQREVLEIVALMDSIELDRLEQLVDSERIAELLDTGTLDVLSDRSPRIRVANSLIADVVRASVPFLRRRQLRERVAPFFADPHDDDYQSVLAFAAWTLECGARLEPALAVRAARLANRLFDPEFAIRVASTVSGELAVVAGIQKSRALRMLGRPANAGQILRRLTPAAREGESLDEFVEFVQEVARVEGLVPGFGEFGPLRAEALERIAGSLHGAQAEALYQRLELAGWSLTLGSGDYAAALDQVQQAYDRYAAGGVDESSDYAVRIASMLAECLCAVGRQDDALALVAGLEDADGHTDLAEESLGEVRAALALVYLRTGQWQKRRDIIARGVRGALGRELYRGSGDDSALGVGHLFGGASRLGRSYLMSALGQIRLRDVDNGRGEILAALAYSSALDGDLDLARSYLTESRSGVFSNWGAVASTTYLSLSTEALLDEDSEVAARMLAVAEEYRGRGLAADSLLLASAAARLGSRDAFEMLATDRMPQPGPLPAAVYDWVDGVRGEDFALQLQAAEALHAIGNALFAREVAARVMETAPPQFVERAAAVVREADLVLGERTKQAGLTSRFDGLTKRERDVSALVAQGMSNRDIAAALHLSVRTVESYLQSAFGKLGVANRVELAQLSAAAG